MTKPWEGVGVGVGVRFEPSLTRTGLALAMQNEVLRPWNKLQHVQNALARVVTKSTRFTSTKSLMERLHWLPVASRIDFKIATLSYKAVHLKQPPCLAQHLKLKSMHLNTRINDQLLLQHRSNLWVLTVMDVLLSAIRRPQFGISFHTKFLMHHR